MDSKNSIIGALLIGVLFIALIYYSQYKQAQEKANAPAQTEATSPSPADVNAPAQPNFTDRDAPSENRQDSPSPASEEILEDEKRGPFAAAAKGKEDLAVLENKDISITFSSRGGKIKQVSLKEYKTWDGKPLILFNDKSNNFSFQFLAGTDQIVNTDDYFFEKSVDGKSKISFKLTADNGGYLEQSYELDESGFELKHDVRFINLEKVVPLSNTFVSVNWNSTLLNFEKDLPTERRYSALYYKYKDKDVEHLSEDKNEESSFETPVEWISFKQQFFNATLFSEAGSIKSGKLKTFHENEMTGYVKKYSANLVLPYRASPEMAYNLKWYLGPNHYSTLKSTGTDFENIVKLGPDFLIFSWFKYINKWFIIPVFNLFDRINLNYGLIILLMTLIVKIILHPLTYKSYKSAASMKLLTPELNELREKYKDDQQKLGTEQMKLYQKAGVSPFGGCLPMVLQMPILIAMYYFFPASIELRQQPFLWATDLSTYDAIVTFSKPIALLGDHISLFTVLMTVTSILQAVMNSNMNAMSAQQPGMKYLPYIMPLMLMFIFNSFPAALTYYYLLQNLLGVGQQWIIQKFIIDEDKLRKQIEENKKKPKAQSGWQQKLEQMAKQAEQQRRTKK